MADLGLTEILSLVKAGYRKKDIEKMKEVAAETPEQPSGDPEPSPSNDPSPAQVTDPVPEADKKTEVTEDIPEPEAQDYKKLYEDLKKETDDMKNTIKDLQQKNNTANRDDLAADTTKSDLLASFRNFS